MKKNFESEIDAVVKDLFAKALELAPRRFNTREDIYGVCPPPHRFVEAEVFGQSWQPFERKHIKQPCPFCMRSMELQWMLACPPESTLEKYLSQDFLFADALRRHLGGCESCRARLDGMSDTTDSILRSRWDLALAAAGGGAPASYEISCDVLDKTPWTLTVPMWRRPMLRDDAHLILYLRLPNELSNKRYHLSLRFSKREYGGVEVTRGAEEIDETVELDLSEVPEETREQWLKDQSWRFADFDFVLEPADTGGEDHVRS